MAAKLMAIVLTLGLTAAGLLAIRQQRLQAVSEMAAAIERASALERQTWKVRASIAERVAPGSLKSRIEPLGGVDALCVPWRKVIPMVAEPSISRAAEGASG